MELILDSMEVLEIVRGTEKLHEDTATNADKRRRLIKLDMNSKRVFGTSVSDEHLTHLLKLTTAFGSNVDKT